jgi:hypothetical protein
MKIGLLFTGRKVYPYASVGRNVRPPGIIAYIVVFIISIIGAFIWGAL